MDNKESFLDIQIFEDFGLKVKHVIIGFVAFVLIIFALSSIKFIGAGQAAIVFNRFRGMSDITLREGINFVNPITVKTKIYDLKLQKTEYTQIEGMSADNQTIGLSLAINWKLQPTHLKEIYQTIVGNVEDTVMHNVIYEVSKASLGKFKIGDIAKNREDLRKVIEDNLKDRMTQYYIDIINISVVDVQFSKEYENAIEAKQVAEQNAQKAEYEKMVVIRAAEGQSRANQLLQQSATKAVIQLEWLKKWNGVLPTVIGGNNTDLLLNMNGNGVAAQ